MWTAELVEIDGVCYIRGRDDTIYGYVTEEDDGGRIDEL